MAIDQETTAKNYLKMQKGLMVVSRVKVTAESKPGFMSA